MLWHSIKIYNSVFKFLGSHCIDGAKRIIAQNTSTLTTTACFIQEKSSRDRSTTYHLVGLPLEDSPLMKQVVVVI